MVNPVRRSRRQIPRLPAVLIGALLVFVFAIPISAAEKASSVDLRTAIIEVAKDNIPAVVHIEVAARKEVTAPSLPFENDPFFRRFFGTPSTPRKFKQETKGLGTGMIIDAQGHILTNHHVAGGAYKIEVTLTSGNKYPATLIGSDPKTDLAIIKISTKERLPHVVFGNSDTTQVGEWVVAIGSPRGLDQTVTQGIISAKHRTGITDPSSYQDFLQTDAAINPGNSGGPLLNLRGEVIGVNTIIVSGSGGFEGIGLAIPSRIATNIANTLIARGKVERGWLGVSLQDVSPDKVAALGLDGPRGAYVADVVSKGPADRGGLRKGDVIVSCYGKPVTGATMFRNEVALAAVGSDVKITVFRGGKTLDLSLRIGDAQEEARHSAASAKARLGAEVRALNPKEMERRGLEPNQGVVIASVDPKGPLGIAGFEVGDMILEMNNQLVAGPQGFAELVNSVKPGQRVTLLAVDRRTGNSGYIQVTAR